MSQQVGMHTITVGDTLLPLNAVLKDGNGDPYNLASYTVKFLMEQEDGTAELAETATGVTAHPTQNFTVDTTLDTLKTVGHGVQEGDQLILTTAGTLPTGLAASTRYFTRDVTPNDFKVAASPDGEKIDITAAGSGTHSFYVVGSVQMDFAAANVDTAGLYRGWFTLTSGTETLSIPEGNRYFRIKIVTRGN